MNRLWITVLLIAASGASALAQDSTKYTRAESPKNAGAAVGLSFLLPGLGQAYAGEGSRGAAFTLLAAAGAIVGGYNLQQVRTCDGNGLFCKTESRSAGLGVAGVAVSVGSWIASMIDAPGSVRRYNARHGLSLVPTFERSGGAARLGLAVQF